MGATLRVQCRPRSTLINPNRRTLALLFAGSVSLAAPSAHAAKTRPARPAAPAGPVALRITPASIRLSGKYATQAVCVTAVSRAGEETDVTAKAVLAFAKPWARVDAQAIVAPVRDGKTALVARFGGREVRVPVEVQGAAQARELQFTRDIQPILTKTGCNQGACHGRAAGQHGFRLSLLGWDAEGDFAAVAHEAGSRRISRSDPAHSLLLMKATNAQPHAGGTRLRPGTREYAVLADWISQGAPFGPEDGPQVTDLRVWPASRIARKGSVQRLLVTARYSDHTEQDVTAQSLYLSNDPSIAGVDEAGVVKVEREGGEAPVMVRYAGLAGMSRFVAPRPTGKTPYPTVPVTNPIDAAVFGKLKTLNILPSRLTSDNEFLRRASLDATGKLPTPDEIRAFVADTAPDKRAKKIDALLDSAAYADWWALKWGDVLQVRTYYDSEAKLSLPFAQWLHQSVSDNMPIDRMAASVIEAAGSIRQHGPVDYYQRLDNTGLSRDTFMVQLSQAFLGVRIRCAQCHHHPYDRWGQDDYWGMASFFQRLQVQNQNWVGIRGEIDLARNPRTGKQLKPTPLGGAPVEPDVNQDPRVQLGDWLSQPDNPFFSRAVVNRVWEQFFGRGLVDPVDDLRATNPASHPELLDGLAKQFVARGFDQKRLIREIMNSRAYQLASETNATNEGDLVFLSHARARRLPAEALLDAITDATEVPQQFRAPYGTRAVQLPDPAHGTEFLTLFGRPSRDTPCECDRKNDSSIPIALHLMNGDTVANKLGDGKGRITRLLQAKAPDDAILDELFLATLSRLPTAAERTAALEALGKVKPEARKEVLEDILWALINSKEFMFNT